MDQQRINNWAGWAVFCISLFVYILTLEPTLSLWDCSEFLVSAWKLEINHSPGAPVFMLLGRFFSLFSFGDPKKAAYSINMVSAASMIIYFRKNKFSRKGFFYTLFISGVGIIALLKIVIPEILDLSKNLELFFVNELHFPIHSGLFTYLILSFTAITAGLYYSHRKQLPSINLAILCLTFLLIGYASYVATIVRASAGVLINQGNPETTFSLLNYLNREK